MSKKDVICKHCKAVNRHYSTFCPFKPLTKNALKIRKRIKQQSDKEIEYQRWKEEVARPALIERDGNRCSCCSRPAYEEEKLDIEHTLNKGSHAGLKRDLNNMTLMCRFPCHFHKTNNKPCLH